MDDLGMDDSRVAPWPCWVTGELHPRSSLPDLQGLFGESHLYSICIASGVTL